MHGGEAEPPVAKEPSVLPAPCTAPSGCPSQSALLSPVCSLPCHRLLRPPFPPPPTLSSPPRVSLLPPPLPPPLRAKALAAVAVGPPQAGPPLGPAGPLAVAVQAVLAVGAVLAGPRLGQVAPEAPAKAANAKAPAPPPADPAQVLASKHASKVLAEGRPGCRSSRGAKHPTRGCTAEAGAAQHRNSSSSAYIAQTDFPACPGPLARPRCGPAQPTPPRHPSLQSNLPSRPYAPAPSNGISINTWIQTIGLNANSTALVLEALGNHKPAPAPVTTL